MVQTAGRERSGEGNEEINCTFDVETGVLFNFATSEPDLGKAETVSLGPLRAMD